MPGLRRYYGVTQQHSHRTQLTHHFRSVRGGLRLGVHRVRRISPRPKGVSP